MGRKEDGAKEMAEIALGMEERKADRKVLLGIYRKLEQIEPDNRQFQEKVQALLAGEKAREVRKKFLRMGVVAAGVGALVVGWVAWPKSAAKRLVDVEALIAQNSPYEGAKEAYDAALVTVDKVLSSAGPGSELETRAKKAHAVIELRRTAKERVAKVEDLRKAIQEEILKPADDLLAKTDYPGAIRKLVEMKGRLTDSAASALQGPEMEAMSKALKEEVRQRLLKPADLLKADWKAVQTALGMVSSVDIQKADDAKQREVYENAGSALKARDRGDWKATVDALTEAVRKLGEMDGIRISDLRHYIEEMENSFSSLEDGYHQAHAAVSLREVRVLYSRSTQAVKEAKAQGDLPKGITACEEFLARCDALRRLEPKKYFAPVVERLFDVLKLDVEVRDILTSLRTTRDGLDRAKRSEENGDLQGSFETLRSTIAAALDVNFQGLALLPLRIESRPPGAQVKVTLPGQEVLEVGKTPFLLRYPYQGRTLVQVEMKGFEPALIERNGIDQDRTASVVVDLQRSLRWRSMAGAAVEGRPGITPDLVLVATRGGLFRAFSREDGGEKFQLKTDHLSGISSGILVEGGNAYFGGNDGEAFAVDVAKQAFRWRKKTEGPATATPVAVDGGIVAFADSDGRVYGLKAGDGAQAWRAELGSPPSGDLFTSGGLVLAGANDNRLVAYKGLDGTVAWTAKLPGPPVTVAPDGAGGLLVATEASTLTRLKASDGTESWTAKTGSPVRGRITVRSDGILAVTATGMVLRITAADGREAAKPAPLGRNLDGGCSVLGDTLYASGAGGVLIAWDLRAGKVLWQLTDLGLLRGEPAVAEGILVVAAAGSGGPVLVLDP